MMGDIYRGFTYKDVENRWEKEETAIFISNLADYAVGYPTEQKYEGRLFLALWKENP